MTQQVNVTQLLLSDLADLARRVAEASGQKWQYAAVVINVGDELPRLQPVVVTPEDRS